MVARMTQPETVDLACEEAIRNPAAYFARIREQGGDVQWSDAQRGWIVLSHAGCEAAFRESETLSADRTGPFARAAAHHSAAFSVVVDFLAGWMNFRDPPAHTRLREPVRASFTPRAVSSLEGDIRTIVEGAVAAFPDDVVDLHSAFCRPVPAAVIAALLGVTGIEPEKFCAWSDNIGTMVFSPTPWAIDEGPAISAATEFSSYFSGLLAQERVKPTGSILTALIQHASEELSETELVGACALLLVGGHETTTTLLGNALAILIERPDLQEWLRSHPESDGTAIDEFVRTVGPARAMPRKVAKAHVRGGAEMKPGQSVYAAIVSANHDPAVFANPGTFNPTRDPNPHLGFGWGLHYCLGANLARLEAKVAIRALLDTYRVIETAGPLPQVKASSMGFGRRPLPVRLRK